MLLDKQLVVDSEGTNGESSERSVCVIMRHAERYDCVWDTCSTPWLLSSEFQQWPGDPPLSTQGIEHAKEVGKNLRNDDKMKNLQHIIVISSPFFRCVQTAAEICHSFDRSSMFIDNQIGEIWNPDVVGELKQIRPRMQVEKWCQEQGIFIEGEALGSWPVWPETESEAETRYALRFLQYAQLSLSKKGCAFVFVTHGDGVKSMLRSFPEHAGTRIHGVEYCGRFVAWHLPIACHDSGTRSSLGIHSKCNESWQVETYGMRMWQLSKESNRSKDASQSKEQEIANRPYDQICRNGSSFNFSTTHRSRSFDIISEAASAGDWPPSLENALHKRRFFDASDDELTAKLSLHNAAAPRRSIHPDTCDSSSQQSSRPSRKRTRAERYKSSPPHTSYTIMESHDLKVPRTFCDCERIVKHADIRLPPSPSTEISLMSPWMLRSKILMRRRKGKKGSLEENCSVYFSKSSP
jgi:broad specificity phosphatase PhoE